MKKLQIFIQFLFFISIFLFNSSTLLGMEFPRIKKLESLQQKDFKGASLDCGYFAIYNAVQMVGSSNKDERILQEALLNKNQFQDNYVIWKVELKKGTFLSADEIEKILNNKNLHLPKDQIFVLGDPNLFEALKKAANSYTKLKELANTDKTLDKLDLIIKLAHEKEKSPFALIYRLKDMPHWITYGVRANNGSFQVFYTNSLTQPTILPEEVEAALKKAESEDERKVILESAKEFEEQRKKIEESSKENARIILKLLENYKKQLFKIQIPTTFSRPLEDIFKATIPEAQSDELSQSLAESKLPDSWIKADKEFNEKQSKMLAAEKELQNKKDAEEAEKEKIRKFKENIQQEKQRLKSPTLSAEDEKEERKKAQEAQRDFLRPILEKLRTNLNESTVIIENKEKHVENQEKALEKATEAFEEGKKILLTISKTQTTEIEMPSELTDMKTKIKQSKEKIAQEKKDLEQKEEELKQIEQEVKTYTATLYRIETPEEKEKKKEIQISEQERQKEQAILKREAEEKASEELARKLQEEEKPTKEKMELPQNIRKQVAEKLNAAQTQLNRKSIIGATKPFKEAIILLEKNNFLTQEKAAQLQRNFKAPLGQAKKTLQEVQDLLK